MVVKLFNFKLDLMLIIVPIIYIIIGIVCFQIIKRIITRATSGKRVLKATQKQRIETLRTLIINIIKYLTVIFVLLGILSVFGINVKSILAGLGIGTAIIGLAFQDLAKDLIAGFSIITEGEYEIKKIVAREEVLRAEIDKIIEEIENNG